MKDRLKYLAESWLPPALLPPLRRAVTRLRQGRPEWAMLRGGWGEGDPAGEGWLHPSVVAAQLSRWPDFLAAVQGQGPLGISHEARRIRQDNASAHNAILCFLHVLSRAGLAAGGRPVRVLDWGGGLGYYAAIARAALPELALDYTVKDMAPVCAAARPLLPEVRFESEAEASLARHYDLIFASNSIHYERDWPALLRRFATAAPSGFVFLSRLPLARLAQDFVIVQRPNWAGYDTEYRSWVFNRTDFLVLAGQAGLTLEREFLMPDEPTPVPGAPEPVVNGAFLFRAKAAEASGG